MKLFHKPAGFPSNGADLSRQWEVSSSTSNIVSLPKMASVPKLSSTSRLARQEARPRSNPQALGESYTELNIWP